MNENKKIKEPFGNDYHHGNLKESVIDAYLDLLETQTPDSISLRKVASKVGVSATAVYNHFSSKLDLVMAVRIRCLYQYMHFLEDYISTDLSPREMLKQLGKAYFLYAKRYPRHYYLAFNTPLEEDALTDEVIKTGLLAEGVTRIALERLLEEEGIPVDNDLLTSAIIVSWSLVQGLVSLSMNNMNTVACNKGIWPKEYLLDNEESIDKVYESIQDLYCEGVIAFVKKNM